MADAELNLSKARILVTNDDGILAPGLAVLERIARQFSDDVWIVAPESEQSAASHSLTLRRPLRVRRLAETRFSVDGTPTDCVLLAQKQILKDHPAGLVLSGVNQGGNLGEDVSYSGTVAAAKESASLGQPAVAFSLDCSGTSAPHWDTAERFGVEVLRQLATFAWPRGLLVNVNFPNLPPEAVAGLRVCDQGHRDASVEVHDFRCPQGRPYHWIGDFTSDAPRDPGSDLAAIADGYVSVTPLHLDMTHRASLDNLEAVMA